MNRLLISLMLLGVTLSANAEFKLPDYQSYQLANGLQVYLMPQHEVPLIEARLTVKAGAMHDSQSFGLANSVGDALSHGAGNLSKTQIEDLLAFHGARLGTETNSETTQISLSFASKDQEKLLPLLGDLILQPQFDPDEFKKYQTRQVSQLKQKRESPKSLLRDLFNKTYYGDHPYGNPVQGDDHSVAAIQLAAVKAFHAKYFTPQNSALVLVGDFQPETMKLKLEKLFARWQGEQPQTPLLPLVAQSNKPRVLLVNKSDAIETTFMIGGKGVAENHPDTVAIEVINTILGARFTSWLNDELRVNSGLTYGARSSFQSFSNAGTFAISTFTKKETTFEAIDLALKTYQRLWEKGIDQETLLSAKAYVKGQFPPDFETSNQLAAALSKNWALGLGDGYINQFEAKVSQLNPEKANQVAQKVFPNQGLVFILIGKADELREQAKNYGEVSEIDINTFHF